MQIAFFDLDKTLLDGSSSMAFVQTVRRSTKMSRRTLARLGLAYMDYKKHAGHEQSLRLAEIGLELAKGLPQSHVRSLISENLEEVIDPLVFPEAIEVLRGHRSNGHLTVVVSSSPGQVVRPIAEHLGIDHAIASIADVDCNDRFTGTLAYFAYGDAKVDAMSKLASANSVDL